MPRVAYPACSTVDIVQYSNGPFRFVPNKNNNLISLTTTVQTLLIQIYWTLRGSAVELLDNLSRFPTECWVVQESFNALITRYVKSFEMTQLFLEICPGEFLPKIAYVRTGQTVGDDQWFVSRKSKK